ncbi:hypothetical protein FI667_g9591, partial [Globisporangium splendens]
MLPIRTKASTVVRDRKRKQLDVTTTSRVNYNQMKMPPSATPTQCVRTCQRRKLEIEQLHKERTGLEAELALFKHRAANSDPTSIDQEILSNIHLREMTANNQLLIAGLRSLVGSNTSDHVCSPVSSSIHLGINPEVRRQQILAMKAQKLHDAKLFLENRTRFMDRARPFSETTQFQTREGDTYVAKFDSIPLPGASSVKQVFDALTFYNFNLEICTAEIKGAMVVREEADPGDEIASHSRLVYMTMDGVAVETNNILFAEYSSSPSEHPSAGKEDSEVGLLMTDFADQDEMYPYRPHERIREDMMSIFMVQSFPSSFASRAYTSYKKEPTDLPELYSEETCERVVVLTRWVQARLHHSELLLSDEVMANARNEMTHINDAVVTAVREAFRVPIQVKLAVCGEDDPLLAQHHVPLDSLLYFSEEVEIGLAEDFAVWPLVQDVELQSPPAFSMQAQMSV